MKKVLIAVDESKGSEATAEAFIRLFACIRPETVILLYVEKMEGRSLMDEMLGPAELSTLREQLQGTEYQEHLDKKAAAIMMHYRKRLEDKGVTGIKTIVKEGHPAEEILATARQEGADMVIIGSRGRRAHNLLMGSVSREVANSADMSVLLAR
jgi:nucleotide-binding universal stress UspA family protein